MARSGADCAVLVAIAWRVSLNTCSVNRKMEGGRMTQLANPMKACIKSNSTTPEYFSVEGCCITELSNFAADFEVAIARACLQPGTATRGHYLRGTGERYAVFGGVALVALPCRRALASSQAM